MVNSVWRMINLVCDRRFLFFGLCSLLLAPCSLAQAQQSSKVPHIGFLSATSEDARVDAFRHGLRELGYVEGQNITVEYRWAAGNFARHHLPSVSGVSEFADAGLLLSYGPNFPEAFRRAAIYVDKILKGAKPADLPVERSRKFELVINLDTAERIGVTVAQSVLLQADRVIR